MGRDVETRLKSIKPRVRYEKEGFARLKVLSHDWNIISFKAEALPYIQLKMDTGCWIPDTGCQLTDANFKINSKIQIHFPTKFPKSFFTKDFAGLKPCPTIGALFPVVAEFTLLVYIIKSFRRVIM